MYNVYYRVKVVPVFEDYPFFLVVTDHIDGFSNIIFKSETMEGTPFFDYDEAVKFAKKRLDYLKDREARQAAFNKEYPEVTIIGNTKLESKI